MDQTLVGSLDWEYGEGDLEAKNEKISTKNGSPKGGLGLKSKGLVRDGGLEGSGVEGGGVRGGEVGGGVVPRLQFGGREEIEGCLKSFGGKSGLVNSNLASPYSKGPKQGSVQNCSVNLGYEHEYVSKDRPCRVELPKNLDPKPTTSRERP